MAVNLPKLPNVERLSGSVVRIMGGNSNKFTLQGTNTYLLGTDPSSLILIDTAQGFPAWRRNLTSHLSSQQSPVIKTCILTHWHGDHTMGVSDLLSLSPDTKIYKGLGNSCDPDSNLKDVSVHEIHDSDTFTDDHGLEIQALHCPGHTKDHMALIITKSIHPDEVGSIFTGDNVLGHGTAVFENLAIYLSSLEKMKNRVMDESSRKESGKKVVAYPAHGVVIDDAQAKIEGYIQHRKMREDEAMNVLRYGSVKKNGDIGTNTPVSGNGNANVKEWASMDMVKIIYKDVPVHLHEPAERGLLMVLEKLKGEGRVIKGEKGWRVSERGVL